MPYFLAPLWTTDPSSLNEDELWDHYEKCLNALDWFSAMSDDHGVWRSGEAQRAHLNDVRPLVHNLDSDRADSLYHKACPWTNPDGSSKEDW